VLVRRSVLPPLWRGWDGVLVRCPSKGSEALSDMPATALLRDTPEACDPAGLPPRLGIIGRADGESAAAPDIVSVTGLRASLSSNLNSPTVA